MIGAGSSGIASCQVLHARGIDFDCFEMGSEVGGNWRYMNDNGMSSSYRSLHINTSRRPMAYATYPMPGDYPDYPSHGRSRPTSTRYVYHFGFRDRIRFRTEVTKVEPAEGGGWKVSWRDSREGGGSDVYGAGDGRQRPPLGRALARPAFRSGAFEGDSSTFTTTRRRTCCEGKRVLVLGIGNSATDIAVETSRTPSRPFSRCVAAPGRCRST